MKWSALLFASAALCAADAPRAHPDFTGRWQMDREKTDLGPNQTVPEEAVEIIDHRDPRLVITTLSRDREHGQSVTTLEFSTDGADRQFTAGTREVHARSSWDGDTLKTWYLTTDGPQLLETRSLSPDRKTLRVDVFLSGPEGELRQVRLMRRVESVTPPKAEPKPDQKPEAK